MLTTKSIAGIPFVKWHFRSCYALGNCRCQNPEAKSLTRADRGNGDLCHLVLVEFSDPIGLFQLIALKRDLEALLGRRVDIGTQRSLKPQVKGRVLQEAIRIF